MASGMIAKGLELKTRQLNIKYTVAANGFFQTDIKSLIDADLPQGCRFIGISGYTANDLSVYTSTIMHRPGNYGLELQNTSSSSKTNTFVLSYFYI